jgi:outer membrane protein TolC
MYAEGMRAVASKGTVLTMSARVAVLCVVVAACTARAEAQPPAPQPSGSNPFFGSVSKGEPTAQPLSLTLKDAVQRALQNNLGLLLQEEAAVSARGARWRALADLLPNAAANVSERRQIINLQAFGFPANPPLVGPFNVFDGRISVSQPVVDLNALNGARAASLNLKAAQYGIKDARDLVVLVSVNLYLEAVAAASRLETARAQEQVAQALLTQAQDLKAAGLVAGIDVLRAQVQLQTQRQRSIAAENDFEKSKLQLARAVGIPVGQALTLADRIPYAPMPIVTLEDALKRAYDTRPDYLAARSRFEAAQATQRAAASALLPSVRVDADYGAIGQTVSGALRTYTVIANVRVPIFEGTRNAARRIEADAALREREAELSDFRGRIEFEVRSAFLDLRSAEQQLQAAQTNVQLAQDELTQARDRFAAGVVNNLEVTQAQEAVASASETYIGALYTHNLAKATLARALGVAESAVMSYLGGQP